jgi:hypothetical protein
MNVDVLPIRNSEKTMDTNNREVRSLTADELDAVAGGVMETVFQYGDTRIEITASAHDYMVCTFQGGRGTCTIVQ